MAKTIFITGTSRGFGKIWAEAFLERGDNVVATARDLSTLDELEKKFGSSLLPIQLDVNHRSADITAVKKAKDHFGGIDVLINNAGYGLFGAIEETTEKEARGQIETNFFGLLWMTQAVLPVMREQGHGHIIQVSSVLGVVTAPTLGLYNASKFAVEGLSETLAAEVKDFGINVTLVEPNAFSTEWSSASASLAQPMKAYEKVRTDFGARLTPDAIGRPGATIDAILGLVDSRNPPLRMFIGKMGYPWTKQIYAGRMAEWEAYSAVSAAAHGH